MSCNRGLIVLNESGAPGERMLSSLMALDALGLITGDIDQLFALAEAGGRIGADAGRISGREVLSRRNAMRPDQRPGVLVISHQHNDIIADERLLIVPPDLDQQELFTRLEPLVVHDHGDHDDF